MIFELLVAGAITLATIRRYSVAKTVIFMSLVIFLISSLTGVLSAPSYNHEISKFSTRTMDPWEKPCGTILGSSAKRFSQRHSAHRSLKRVRTQLRVAQNHIRKDKQDIEHVYSKVYKVLKRQYNLSWLPKNQLKWYYSEVWCMEKDRKAEHALPRLHDALQRFAITFHSLKRFRLKSDINVDWVISKRNDIIGGMETEVLRTLCEVENAIINLGHQLPKVHKTKVVTDNPDWATEGDLTVMLVQDWGVFRRYRTFLNDWIRAFRNATAKGSGTCDPNTVKPLIFKKKQKNNKKPTRLKTKASLKKKKVNQQEQQQQLREKIRVESNKKKIQEKRRELRQRLLRNRSQKNSSINIIKS